MSSTFTPPSADIDPAVHARIEIAMRVLANMTKACKFMSMYPDGHRRIDEAEEMIRNDLVVAFEMRETLVIGTVTGRLSVDGTPVTQVDSSARTMLSILDNMNVENIVFRKGIPIEEIDKLIRLFAAQPGEVLVDGKIPESLLEGFFHVKIDQIKIGLVRHDDQAFLPNTLRDLFEGRTNVELGERAIAIPIEAISGLVDALAQSCRSAMEQYRVDENADHVRSVTAQTFVALMPLLMSKDLGDLRGEVTRVFEALGEDGLELVFGRPVSIQEAVQATMKEVPTMQRSSMMLDEVAHKDVDLDDAAEELSGIFEDGEVGTLARLASEKMLAPDAGAAPEEKLAFMNKVMDMFEKGIMQPIPTALIHESAQPEKESVPPNLNKAGVHCISTGDKNALVGWADAFQPSFMCIDASDLDSPRENLRALRSVCPDGFILVQNAPAELADPRKHRGLKPCEISTMMITHKRVVETALRKLKRTEEEGELTTDADCAHNVQLSLLPREVLAPEGYQIASFYEACRHVGGDYYDVIDLPDGGKMIVVADVAGKGLPGAMVMVMVRSVLRMLVEQGLEGDELMKALNTHIAQDTHAGLFVTVSLTIYRPDTDSFLSYRAGQMPLAHIKPDGTSSDVEGASGMAVGAVDTALFEKTISSTEVKLQSGEALCCYTDGINEAKDADGRDFGMERLHAALSKTQGQEPREMIGTLLQDIEAFTGDAPRSDDMTIVMIRKV